MITLINLNKSGTVISANYFSEDNRDDQGHIEYDMKEKKVLSYLYSEGDKKTKLKYDFNKAMRAIEKLIEYNKFPETYRYIWY